MDKDFYIKVCGMCAADNIKDVLALGVDMIGLNFWPKSPRYVKSVNVKAGIIPNTANRKVAESVRRVKRVGVFVDEMPQTVITHAYNYKLDYLQFHGNESPICIDNLRRTLVPDILPDVKFIKVISVGCADDVQRWREYDGHVDMLLFDTKCKEMGGSGRHFEWDWLMEYDGGIPFLLSGGIGPDDAERVREFKHPMCVGVDINSRFETAPGIKDVDKIRDFIGHLK